MKSVLRCSLCSTVSDDIRRNAHAWDRWQVVPVDVCPKCIAQALNTEKVQVYETQSMGRVLRTFDVVGVNS